MKDKIPIGLKIRFAGITFLLMSLFTMSSTFNTIPKKVKINNQVWMTKNLNVDRFQNGELIQQVYNSEEWLTATNDEKPVWCYFTDDVNGEKYGKYYNWYAVNDPRGLAPKGWHIPSDEEWLELTTFLGGSEIAGTKMKNKTGWIYNDCNGTNVSGFSGIPSGYFDCHNFQSIGSCGHWWSSSDTTDYFAFGRQLGCRNGSLVRDYYGKDRGLPVRCIKD